MKFDWLEYQVADFPSMPQLLRVEGNGRARYESHTNEYIPDLPEIGVYAAELSAREIGRIAALVEDPSLQALPDHWGKADSGDRFRRLRVRRGEETIEKLVGARAPVDPRLQKMFDQLDKTVGALREHPARVLRVKLTEVSFTRTAYWQATLVLTNTGSQAMSCWRPARTHNPADSALRVELWPNRAPAPAQPGDLSTAPVEVLDNLPPSAEGAAIIHLEPAESVSIRVAAQLPLQTAAGTYINRVSYSNMVAPGSGSIVIAGEIFSKATEIVVR